MSFAEYETSLQNGRPIRLYQFQRGPLKWGYTSADRNITHQSVTFRAIEGGVSDDGIRQTEDAQADTLTLTVPALLDVAQMYRVIAPGQTVYVTIFDLHYGDNGFLVIWMGQIAGVKFKSLTIAEIQCQNLSASLERTGLRKVWSRNCPHHIYDQSCQAKRADYRFDGIIDRIDAVSIGIAVAAIKPDRWFAGGYIEWTSQYGLEQRGIESHTNDLLTIFGGTFGLANGQALAIYAGCDRLFDTCKVKFNNTLNYGGAPYMPGKSPFDGTPVF
ncbi:phage BR0599 family protein [Acinetobacter puyangensis]|uniref:phage BR0599 family protein n=1 Tax=Acinetobacter puyangensis TaxID=1096779 RepID=UPI003A4D1F6D